MPTIQRVTESSQNILGKSMPTIYISGIAYILPRTDRGNRLETFDKETITWTDLDRRVHERIKGYRLRGEYEWDYLTPDQINDLLNIYNEAQKNIDIKIKFSNFQRRYDVKVESFEHKLASGLAFKSGAKIEFMGIALLDAFPNPDLFYTMPPLLGRGIVVRTLVEQGL